MNGTHGCPPAEVLTDYLLRTLPDVQGLQVEAHVEACAACALEVRTLRNVLQLADEVLEQRELMAPPPSPRLMAMVAQQVPLHKRITRWLWDKINVPIPAWQAVLGGATLIVVFQLALPPEAPPGPRPPDLSARPIPVGGSEAAQAPAEEHSTPQTADQLPADQFANAW